MKCEKQRMMNKTKRRSHHLCMQCITATSARIQITNDQRTKIWILSFSLVFFVVAVAMVGSSWFPFSPDQFVRWVNETTKQLLCSKFRYYILDIKKKPMRWNEHNENSTINWKNSSDNNNYFNFYFCLVIITQTFFHSFSAYPSFVNNKTPMKNPS